MSHNRTHIARKRGWLRCYLTYVGPEKMWGFCGGKINRIPTSCPYFIHKQPTYYPSPLFFRIAPISCPGIIQYLPACPYSLCKLPTLKWRACWEDVDKSSLCSNNKCHITSRVCIKLEGCEWGLCWEDVDPSEQRVKIIKPNTLAQPQGSYNMRWGLLKMVCYVPLLPTPPRVHVVLASCTQCR